MEIEARVYCCDITWREVLASFLFVIALITPLGARTDKVATGGGGN